MSSAINHCESHTTMLASPALAHMPWGPAPSDATVELMLAEGSSFLMNGHDVLAAIARRMQTPLLEPNFLLQYQLLPAVTQQTELLLEFAEQLTWPEACTLAQNPVLLASLGDLAEAYRQGCILSLSPVPTPRLLPTEQPARPVLH